MYYRIKRPPMYIRPAIYYRKGVQRPLFLYFLHKY